MAARKKITESYNLALAKDVQALSNHPRSAPYYQQIHPGLSVGLYVGKKGVSWRGRYYDELGRKVESVFPGVTNWKGATTAAANLRDSIDAGEHQSKPEAAEERRQKSQTLQALWDEYLDSMALKKGGEDSAQYRKYKRQQNAQSRLWRDAIGKLRPAELTEAKYTRVVESIQRTGITNESVNRRMRSLRTILNRALNAGLVDAPWWRNIRELDEAPPQEKSKVYRYFDKKQRQAFIDAAPEEVAAFCRFMFAFGCRPSEASRLKVRSVDFDRGVLHLVHYKGAGTGGKHRVFPLKGERLEMCRALVEGKELDAPLLPNKFGRAYGDNFGKYHRQVADEVGLPESFDSYSWRHCWITDSLRAGVRIDHVSKLAGTSVEYIIGNYSQGDDQLADSLPGVL